MHLLYFQINCRLLLSHRDRIARYECISKANVTIACRSRWSGGPETAEARIPRKFRNVSARAEQKKFRVWSLRSANTNEYYILINKANTARWRRILVPTKSRLIKKKKDKKYDGERLFEIQITRIIG